MMVLVGYDVSQDEGGVKRLRRVAKTCENIGQRVQKSLFECIIEPSQLVQLKGDLLRIIDPERDSLRLYLLGKNWRTRVENYGVAQRFEQDGPLIF